MLRRPATLIFVLALILTVAAPDRAQAALPAASAPIDPAVLADTAGGATGHFLVVLAGQADTAAAAARARTAAAGQGRAVAWAAQGQAVYDALQAAAAAGQPSVIAALDALGASHRRYSIVNLLAVTGDRRVVEALAARPDVARIASDRAFRAGLEAAPAITAGPAGANLAPAGAFAVPGLVSGTPQWNVAQINAPGLWALGFRGQGTVYANADTGVQWDHPALKAAYRGWNGAAADHNYNWWDAIHTSIPGGFNPCGLNLDHPCDDYGHGTHVMGTGVGDGGPAYEIGVAPGASWIACRNMDQGYGRPSTYLECLQFFLAPWKLDGTGADPARRPDVIGNSYTCPPSEGCTDPAVFSTALANLRAAGIFPAVAAGNAGPACSAVATPPGLESAAVSVGATDSSNNLAYFSSRGPVTVDGSYRRKPDLVAPGVSVLSSVPGSGYRILSGTSMATPHVAAAVALLWSALPGLRHEVDLTEYLLERSAPPLTTTDGCGGDTATQVPNNSAGFGRLDVLAAYNLALTSPPPANAMLAITGTVWLDLDRNRVREPGEPPVAGVVIHARHDGQPVAQSTSGSDGSFSFSLPAGFYDLQADSTPDYLIAPSAIYLDNYYGPAVAGFGAWPARPLYFPLSARH